MRPSAKAILAKGARCALVFLPLLALPALSLAAGGEGGEGSGRALWDLFWRIVNFLILVGILVYFTRKPIASAIKNSIESVRTHLKEAEESRAESEARMKEAEEKLAGVDKEISALLESARKEGEAERERILNEAAQALEKIKAEAALAVEMELKKARDILRREASETAVAIAEEIISRNLTPEDQARFITEYLEKLEANQ